MHKNWLVAALSVGMLFGLPGCGGDDDDPDSGDSSPAAASGATSTVAPTAATGDSDAPALYGRWIATLADGSDLRLTLQEGTYRATSVGGTGFGAIDVRGNEIEFLDSNYCPGEAATYTWSVDDDVLTFIPLGPDPCGRADFLIDTTYERLD